MDNLGKKEIESKNENNINDYLISEIKEENEK